jgi:protein-S-isoprenylcysteine O-methyltransferase Ste14
MGRFRLIVIISVLAAEALLITSNGTQRQSLAAGIGHLIIGVPLLLLSRSQLGRAFSVMPKASILVTHGLYSKIPHPMYAFLDLVLLGIIIALRMPWLIALWLALVAVQAWQAKREARLLEKTFGDAYRRYRAQTWW